MASSFPPRYLPTLTEVVLPEPARIESDQATLTAEVLKIVTPMVEQELRSSVLAQVESQLEALLPALQQKIEEAVRQALRQAQEKPLSLQK